MVDKIALLSLLVASLSFGTNATELGEEAQDVPAIEAENSEDAKNKDISAEEAQAKDENKDELKKEHKCDDADKECDEEKMTEDEKDKSIKIEDSSKED